MKRKSLKKSKSGSEVEFFLINSKGEAVKESKDLIKHVNKKYPELGVRPEAGQTQIEIGSYPSVNVLDTFIDLLENTKKLIDCATHKELSLFPLGTYPGKIKPEITDKRWYLEQSMILGRENYINATLCCGFHYHYTLPRGVFDFKKKFLKESKNSKLSQSMIDSYNLSIAFDPAITTILQSSPFAQGKFLAKDSRMLMYRGGKKLGYLAGKYGKYQSLGGLPPYKQTLGDLIFSLSKRQNKWKELMLSHNLVPRWLIKKDNVLLFTWNPVKINPLGTLELRGMDMNHPNLVIAMGSLLKFVYRQIYRDFYRVMPSDIGKHEPFKLEGNIIHIPPHTHVRNILQKESAYNGFDNKEVANYVKRFFRFAKQFLDDNYKPVMKPLQKIIDNKETVSDTILKHLKKKGYSKNDRIPQSVAGEIALMHSDKMLKEVHDTEEKLLKAN